MADQNVLNTMASIRETVLDILGRWEEMQNEQRALDQVQYEYTSYEDRVYDVQELFNGICKQKQTEGWEAVREHFLPGDETGKTHMLMIFRRRVKTNGNTDKSSS